MDGCAGGFLCCAGSSRPGRWLFGAAVTSAAIEPCAGAAKNEYDEAVASFANAAGVGLGDTLIGGAEGAPQGPARGKKGGSMGSA
eukprot:1145219-Pelagomonas_calceolata.AAC.10